MNHEHEYPSHIPDLRQVKKTSNFSTISTSRDFASFTIQTIPKHQRGRAGLRSI